MVVGFEGQCLMYLVVVDKCHDGAFDPVEGPVVVTGTLPQTHAGTVYTERGNDNGIARNGTEVGLTRSFRFQNSELSSLAQCAVKPPPAEVSFPRGDGEPDLMALRQRGNEVRPARLAGERRVGGHTAGFPEPGEEVGYHGGVDKRMLRGCATTPRFSTNFCLGNGLLVCGVAYT